MSDQRSTPTCLVECIIEYLDQFVSACYFDILIYQIRYSIISNNQSLSICCINTWINFNVARITCNRKCCIKTAYRGSSNIMPRKTATTDLQIRCKEDRNQSRKHCLTEEAWNFISTVTSYLDKPVNCKLTWPFFCRLLEVQSGSRLENPPSPYSQPLS